MVASCTARRSAPSTGGVKPRRNSKRRRLKSPKDSKEPIVFHSPGLKPDVRLTVFKQEFHVHSVILKLHSNSFRKFLDSPQKEAVPASSPFKYDYISVFDDDDITWGLEPLATAAKATSSSVESFADAPILQAKVVEPFRKLLCSMYTRPYVIEDAIELLELIRLADYYCSLPNLSGTISTALLGSPMFERESSSSESRSEESIPSEFVQRADEIIFAAKKLRHPVLFRECFIHLVDRLHGSFYYGSAFSALREDKDLWLLLSEGKSNLRQLILQAQNAILMASMDGLLRVDLKDQMIDALRADPENSAWFFKHMLDLRELTHCVNDEEAEEMFAPIEILLRSNLALDQTDFGAGEGPYKNIFLCAELADEDMPWDAAEFDW